MLSIERLNAYISVVTLCAHSIDFSLIVGLAIPHTYLKLIESMATIRFITFGLSMN